MLRIILLALSFSLLLPLASTLSAAESAKRIEVEVWTIQPTQTSNKSQTSGLVAANPAITVVTAYPSGEGFLYQCDHAPSDSPFAKLWTETNHQPE